MMTPENRVKNKVRDWLKANGAYVFSPVQMGIGSPTLDLLCCLFGLFVGIEVKAEGKKPTPRQVLSMKAVQNAGGIAVWGDSLETIKQQVMDALIKAGVCTPK